MQQLCVPPPLHCRRWRCRATARERVHGGAASAAAPSPAELAPPGFGDRRHMVLHAAAHEGDFTAVAALLARGEPVNATTDDGETPLHLAVVKRDFALVQLLCDHSADVSAADQYGDTPLHRATPHGAIVDALLARGAPVALANRRGDQPLHAAAFLGRVESLRALIRASADVDARGHGGECALAVASRQGHMEAVRFLIERGGASIAATDASGRSALHVAADAHGPKGIVECLLFYRAQPDERLADCLMHSTSASEAQRASDAASTRLTLPLSPSWQQRVKLMPPLVRRLLVYGEDPSSIDAARLLLEQAMGTAIDTLNKYRGAVAALSRPADEAVLRAPRALTHSECTALRKAVDGLGCAPARDRIGDYPSTRDGAQT